MKGKVIQPPRLLLGSPECCTSMSPETKSAMKGKKNQELLLTYVCACDDILKALTLTIYKRKCIPIFRGAMILYRFCLLWLTVTFHLLLSFSNITLVDIINNQKDLARSSIVVSTNHVFPH